MTRGTGLCFAIFIAFSAGSSGGNPSPEEDYAGGNWLLVSCQATLKQSDDPSSHPNLYEAYRDGFCRGIVEGVSNASPKVCPPENSTYGQQVRVVVKYMQDHPEELHMRNTTLLEKALAKAFPCP